MANWLEPGNQGRSGLFDLIREFDDWFNVNGRTSSAAMMSPGYDIEEVTDGYRLSIDLPGVRPEDVKIQAQGNQLMINAERSAHENRGRASSRSSMSYRRVFALPDNISADAIEAALENGVLLLHLPKSQVATPRQIQVRSSIGELRGSSAAGQTPVDVQASSEQTAASQGSANQTSPQATRQTMVGAKGSANQQRSTADSEPRQPRH